MAFAAEIGDCRNHNRQRPGALVSTKVRHHYASRDVHGRELAIEDRSGRPRRLERAGRRPGLRPEKPL
jgi:hypothetical protein